MLSRIECSVVVPVSLEVAFQAYCDLDRLLDRARYRNAAWTHGAPWHVGSRFRYETTSPIKTTISAVVISVDPPRSVDVLNHSLGITVEQYTTFEPVPLGDVRVRMTMDFVGVSPMLLPTTVKQMIGVFAQDALDAIATRCRQVRAASSGA